jgi:membrane protein
MSSTTHPGSERGRGREADTPSDIPAPGWKDIFWRVMSEFSEDRVTLIAAGATFYLLLSLFPALAAFVSIYGVVADPSTIADHIAFLGGILPSGGVEMIQSQLQSLISADQDSLSFAFIFGLLFALYSANNGVLTLFEAMNIAYDETEKRSYLKLYGTSFLFTLGAIIVGILFIVSVGVVPAVLSFLHLGGITETLISLLRWPVLFAASVFGISLLYRYGPSRERAKWRWVTWGSAIATVIWIVASILFSWYLTNFADYNATYGSLGAVIGFMMWTWISVTILIFGAELNSEMEHQTARDSTTGPEKPLGARGAKMADRVAKSGDAEGSKSGKPMPSRSEVGKKEGGSDQRPRPQSSDRITEKRSLAVAVPFYTLLAFLKRRNRS